MSPAWRVTACTSDLLSAGTDVHAVTLHAGDIDALAAYYRDAVGLTTLAEGDRFQVLGRGTTPVLVLHHTPGLPRPARNQAGLFHTAILFDDEPDLAASVLSTARHPQAQFVGSADHLVSLALYFTDPEGNGIEAYVDRDRSQWTYPGGRERRGQDDADPDPARPAAADVRPGAGARHGRRNGGPGHPPDRRVHAGERLPADGCLGNRVRGAPGADVRAAVRRRPRAHR